MSGDDAKFGGFGVGQDAEDGTCGGMETKNSMVAYPSLASAPETYLKRSENTIGSEHRRRSMPEKDSCLLMPSRKSELSRWRSLTAFLANIFAKMFAKKERRQKVAMSKNNPRIP